MSNPLFHGRPSEVCSYRWLEPRHRRLPLLLNSENDVFDVKEEVDSSKLDVASSNLVSRSTRPSSSYRDSIIYAT